MEANPLTILCGDALEQLRTLPDESVHCCVTSPPYWGLRDYSTNGQLGLEKTPEEYVAKMVEVFREVWRVLRKDGTLWLNLGDSFAANGIYGLAIKGESSTLVGTANSAHTAQRKTVPRGLKPKDMVGIPWRVAFALQADGWWLRSDIIWSKPNPMPQSVTDRPTKSHEYLFLLTKSANYFYDAEAIKEQSQPSTLERGQYGWNGKMIFQDDGTELRSQPDPVDKMGDRWCAPNRNKRSVWTVATAPYPEAHFATYPPDLIKPCILAGTSAKGCCPQCGAQWTRIIELGDIMRLGHSGSRKAQEIIQKYRGNTSLAWSGMASNETREKKTTGWSPLCESYHWHYRHPKRELTHEGSAFEPIPCTVLDPFAGSGTTGAVALELGRKAILIELNPKYVELIKQRCNVTMGLQLA